jgi:TolB-like protein/Flp pilus assembly protein TadD
MDNKEPAHDAIRAQLAKIVASDTFRGGQRGISLLQFVVEATLTGRAANLKEYTLGADALGRGPKFDPRTDATARVEASRLRTRLDLYYAKEGEADSILVTLPKGSYVPVFTTRSATPPKPTSSLPTLKRVWPRLHLVTGGFVLIILAVAAATWWYSNPAKESQSIAVLPFSTEPEMEYLADGVTEELINRLSNLSNLHVTARSVAFTFKGKSMDPAAIGKQLGVETVVAGRLAVRGDRLTIQVEMVNAATGAQTWGEKFERNLNELISVQEEIGSRVTDRLQLRLSIEERRGLAKRYTNNAEAYQWYLQGLYYSSKPTHEGIAKSIDYYKRAIAADSQFAPAYVNLATNYMLLSVGEGPSKLMPQAIATVRKAIELDDELAEAHAELGYFMWIYGLDAAGSEREFKLALKLDPNSAVAHYDYARMLGETGRFNEALPEARRAVELDPVSIQIRKRVAVNLYLARRYDDALIEYQKLIELAPDFVQTQRELGLVYERLGRYPEALQQFQKALVMPENYARIPGNPDIAYVLAISGKEREARLILDELMLQSKLRYLPAYDIALIHAGLNDVDQALSWLTRALRERSFWAGWIKVDPRLDSVRKDPRFNQLLRDAGLSALIAG